VGGAHNPSPEWHEQHVANYDWIGETYDERVEFADPGPMPVQPVPEKRTRVVPVWRRKK
jgi:hypothetical protein